MVNTGITAKYRLYRQQAESCNEKGFRALWKGEDAESQRWFDAEAEYRQDMLRLYRLMNPDEVACVNN